MLRSNLKKIPELESVATLLNHHHHQEKASSKSEYLEKVKFIKILSCIVLILQKIY